MKEQQNKSTDKSGDKSNTFQATLQLGKSFKLGPSVKNAKNIREFEKAESLFTNLNNQDTKSDETTKPSSNKDDITDNSKETGGSSISKPSVKANKKKFEVKRGESKASMSNRTSGAQSNQFQDIQIEL